MTPDISNKLRDLNYSISPNRSRLHDLFRQVGMTAMYGAGSNPQTDLFNAIQSYVQVEVEYQVYRICSSPDFYKLVIAGASDVED